MDMNRQDQNEAISFAYQKLFNHSYDIPQDTFNFKKIIQERVDQIKTVESSEIIPLPIPVDDQDNISKLTQIFNESIQTSDVWTPEINNVLTYLKFSREYSFKQISKVINNQFNRKYTSKQCQQHWSRVVDPNIIKGRWTPKEDKYLFHLVENKQLSRQEIDKLFPQRTGLQIWKRCNYLGLDVRK